MKPLGTCNLVLSSSFILRLEKTFYVPSFSKNLISVSRLALLGFFFNLSDSSLTLSYEYEIIGYGALLEGLYYINLQNDAAYNNSMHV